MVSSKQRDKYKINLLLLFGRVFMVFHHEQSITFRDLKRIIKIYIRILNLNIIVIKYTIYNKHVAKISQNDKRKQFFFFYFILLFVKVQTNYSLLSSHWHFAVFADAMDRRVYRLAGSSDLLWFIHGS